jgi:hypothetical protein
MLLWVLHPLLRLEQTMRILRFLGWSGDLLQRRRISPLVLVASFPGLLIRRWSILFD